MDKKRVPQLSAMHTEELLQQIDLGIKNGYHENIYFLNQDSLLQTNIREYLLTVNLAQQLHQWINKNFLQQLSVCLECNALSFKKAAFPKYKISATDIFDMEIISPEPKTIKRKGFIDLVLFHEGPNGFSSGKRSYMGIELKAIDPKQSLVVKDVKRLVEIMNATDKIDSNSIQQSAVVYLQRLDNPRKPFYGEQFENLKLNHLRTLEKAVAKIDMGNLTKEIRTTTVTKTTVDDVVAPLDEYDSVTSDQVASESGAVISVMILISRKKGNGEQPPSAN